MVMVIHLEPPTPGEYDMDVQEVGQDKQAEDVSARAVD